MADDVRSRLDRVRGRLPEDADPPVLFKFDATQFPIVWIGVEGDMDDVALREVAEQQLSRRLERVPGVASVDVSGGRRRQIRVELSREKITALDLSVDRVVNLLRTENQNIPVGEIDEGDMTFLLRSPGQFTNLEDIRGLTVMTKAGVPVYMRDIAEVRDSHRGRAVGRARQRQAGRAPDGPQAVGREHRGGRPRGARRDGPHQPRDAGRQAHDHQRHARCSSSSRSPASARR